VVEEITKEQLEKKVGDRKDSVFLEDPAVPEKFRAKLADYFRSGYDRGHQVPSPKTRQTKKRFQQQMLKSLNKQ
jgi:endonuclease G, mitochondrial